MQMNKIIRILEHPARVDNEFSQNISDSETSTQGRSIGDVRDQSAPTVWSGYFVNVHNRPWPDYFVFVDARLANEEKNEIRG